MRTSETTGKLFAAIAAAQAEMPSVGKGATNPHFKSKYATLDAVHAAAQPILAKHGLAMLALTGAEGDCACTTVRVQLGDEWLEHDIYMRPRQLDPQNIGSCNTYARRYLYGMLFGLCTEDDDDGNSTSPQTQHKAPKAKAAPAYAKALNNGVKAAITALGWDRKKCTAVWNAEPTNEAFIAAVTDAAAAVEELPM